MAVRNFWLEARIDGKATKLTGGPVAKDGGFDLLVYQRDQGESVLAGRLFGRASEDGTLTLTFETDPEDGSIRITSKR